MSIVEEYAFIKNNIKDVPEIVLCKKAHFEPNLVELGLKVKVCLEKFRKFPICRSQEVKRSMRN